MPTREEEIWDGITGAWRRPILRLLGEGPMRFKDLRSRLPASVSDGQVSRALSGLAACALVEKGRRNGPESFAGPGSKGEDWDSWALTRLGRAVVDHVVQTVKVLAEPDAALGMIDGSPLRPSAPSSLTSTVSELRSTHRWRAGPDGREGEPRLDTSIPHPARRYDYWLGGKNNFAADRESGDAIVEALPWVKLGVLENRGFLKRAVRFLSLQGVRQFLDIGSGLPTSPNTHEVAQAVNPAARVVYVDNDPLVLSHSQALLDSTPEGETAYIHGDLREPRTIIESPELRRTLDPTQPVGLLLIAVLHFVRNDENPKDVIAELVGALPAGSWLVASHVTYEYVPAERLPSLQPLNRDGRFQDRTADQFQDILGDLKLLPPGIQSVAQWWASDAPQPRPSAEEVGVHGAVGRIA